ncbi:hypothetical protein EUX98_g5170 [Antrodiella citrinella]|uniref:NAD-dependent epimerase/dehydratase domain-containing protein n=1 Tax=Antrodiella citrinella TaxID=2447956 RepID=A0A4S4MS53_9APHY|nr:hypothetical protein EUX98_g5170 [Antrodiella citrinella]
MPAIATGKVLLTGINGFTAMWFARGLLEAGFSVRGTVRSAAKGVHPQKYFSSFGSKLEVVVVEDITKDGAFDEAVKGVDAIVHTTSAFQLDIQDTEVIVGPAVKGVLGVLESARKYGTKVKRIVLLSSTAAIQDQYCPTRTVFTEKDWNDRIIEHLRTTTEPQEKGMVNYVASKMLSERAGWDFMERNKKDIKFDFISLNPGLILGEGLQEVDDPQKLNTSLKIITWTDVHDLVDALIGVLTTPKAGGERFLVSGEQFAWQDWINIVRTFDSTVPEGQANWRREDTKFNVSFDTSKVEQMLNVRYRTWRDSAKEVMDYYRAKGWWGKA